MIVQYQVGTFEKIRIETEKSQGAPDQTGFSYRSIYTERPAKVGRLGEVTDSVRRYDRFEPFSLSGTRLTNAVAASFFQGLTVWYQVSTRGNPEVISLTANRPIRDEEYAGYAGMVNQPFLPRLMALMSPRPARVGDSWPIRRQAAQVLLGRIPEAGQFALEGRLVKVEKSGQGTALTAIVEIGGEVDLEEGPGAVNARITFVFEPPSAAPTAETKESVGRAGGAREARGSEIVEAKGHVARLSMGRRQTVALDDKGRLQQIRTRELVLQRRLAVGPGGAGEAALLVPDRPPAADEPNSWLLYDDPRGRFHLRHPQDLIDNKDPDALVFLATRPDGKSDTVIVADVPKEADPASDRKWTDPQAFVRDLQQNAARRRQELVNGQMGWLTEPDGAPSKRRVYRYEAALKTENSSRLFLDAYLVLFARGDHFVIQAMTEHDDHVKFRDQIERLIGSLELGPSIPGMAGAAAQPQLGPASGPRPTPASPAPAVPPVRTP